MPRISAFAPFWGEFRREELPRAVTGGSLFQ
jgi:hypothetical protein